MPQIIDNPNFGGQAGQAFGSSLYNTLGMLAQHKMQDLLNSKRFAANEAALISKGYSPQEARTMSHLEGPALAASIKTSPGERPTEESINAIRVANGLDPLEPGRFAQTMNRVGEGAQQQEKQPLFPPQLQPNQKQQEAAAIFPEEGQRLANAAKQLANTGTGASIGKMAGSIEKPKKEEAKEVAEAIKETIKPEVKNIEAKPELPAKETLSKYAGLNKKQVNELIESEKEQKRYQHAETKGYEGKLSAEAKSAKDLIEDIKRAQELDEEGVDSPAWNEFLTRSGYDIAALRSGSSQELNKLIEDQVREAKAEYGNRLTDADLKQFFRRWPSLSNSKEGRKRLWASKMKVAQAKIARKETQKEIKREHHGSNPLDIEDMVEERVAPKLDKIYEQYKLDLLKPIKGEEQSKLATFGGALAGDIVKVATPALAGAAAGRFFGPTGALVGAGAGATYGLTQAIRDLFH